MLVYKLTQMLAREMRVAHRGLEVGVSNSLLHLDHILALGDPRRDPPMPEVMEVPRRRQLGAVGRCAHGHAEALDSIALGVVAASPLVMKDPLAPTREAMGGKVCAHTLTAGNWYTVGDPQSYADAVKAATEEQLRLSEQSARPGS